MLPMTRHKTTQTGLGTPSPLDRWINAMLHVFAMLVSYAARRFASRHPISAAECDGRYDRQPEADFVLGQHQDPKPAAAGSHTRRTSASSSFAVAASDNNNNNSKAGLMLGTRPAQAELVDSKDEARPTALSTSHPRACPEDLGCCGGGTLSNPHDLPTEILGTLRNDPLGGDLIQWTKSSEEGHGSGPRMTRCGFSWETSTARAPS